MTNTHCIYWRFKMRDGFSAWIDNPKMYKSKIDAEKAIIDLTKVYQFLDFLMLPKGETPYNAKLRRDADEL